jgi:hypothetical protein
MVGTLFVWLTLFTRGILLKETDIHSQIAFKEIGQIFPVNGIHQVIWYVNMESLRSDLDDLNLIISNIENIKIMEQIVKKDLEKGKKNFTELREIHDLKEYVIDKCKLLNLELSEGNGILKILESLMTDNTKRNKRSLLPLWGQNRVGRRTSNGRKYRNNSSSSRLFNQKRKVNTHIGPIYIISE